MADPNTAIAETGSSPRRFRFKLSAALIAILVIGFILGGVAYVRRSRARAIAAHEQLALQRSSTEEIIAQVRRDLIPAGAAIVSDSMGMGSSYNDWHCEVTTLEDAGVDLIGIRIEGSCTNDDLDPIKVWLTNKGSLHDEIVRRLTEEYRKHKWPYSITQAKD